MKCLFKNIYSTHSTQAALEKVTNTTCSALIHGYGIPEIPVKLPWFSFDSKQTKAVGSASSVIVANINVGIFKLWHLIQILHKTFDNG